MILEVQGRRIEVADGLNQQQLNEVVDTAAARFQQAAPQAPQQEPGLGQRILGDLQQREQTLQQAKAARAAGEITTPEIALRNIGQASGAILDVGGEVARSGFEALPQAVQDPLSFVGQSIGKVAQKGVEAAGQLPVGFGGEGTIGEQIPQELARSPRVAAALGDVGLTASLLAPVKVPGVAGVRAATDVAGGLAGRAGAAVTGAAERQIGKSKADLAADLVAPIESRKFLEQANLAGRVTEQGPLRRRVVAPSERDIRISNVVEQLDVKPSKSFTANNKIVLSGIDDRAKTLIKELQKTKVIFPKSEVKARLNSQLSRLVETNPFLVGNSELTANRVANIVNEAIDNNLSTPAGLLKARKEFDSALKSQTRQASGKTVFDSDADRAVNAAIKEIRDVVNGFIAEKAPGVDVRRLLGEQELLFGARDVISSKASREASNSISRLIDSVSERVPLEGAIGKTLGVGLIAGKEAVAAPIRAVRGPKLKKALGGLLRGVDKAIKLEKDIGVVRQLRADRAIVLELLKEEE